MQLTLCKRKCLVFKLSNLGFPKQLRTALEKRGSAAAADAIMSRADVNGDGEISYDEYMRLMNMEEYGDAEGGNMFVRRFKSVGLLKSNSVLGYTAMVGNKVSD